MTSEQLEKIQAILLDMASQIAECNCGGLPKDWFKETAESIRDIDNPPIHHS